MFYLNAGNLNLKQNNDLVLIIQWPCTTLAKVFNTESTEYRYLVILLYSAK